MDLDAVPQEGNATLAGHRKLMYARAADGRVVGVASAGWEAEEIVTLHAVDAIDAQADVALQLARQALFGRRAVVIARKFRSPHHPVVQQRISRAGIECDQRAVPAYPRDVRDATDIDDRKRPRRQLRRQGTMIGGDERRALAASRDICGAQIVNHRTAR